MKTSIKFPIVFFFYLMLLFSGNSYSQTCDNIVTIYPGPHNTHDLIILLNTSSNSLIASLDCSTKTSLETAVQFVNGLPKFMSDTDANINRIYADTQYCSNLFSAIFGVRDIVCTFATKPKVATINLAQFYKLIGSGGAAAGIAFEPALSHCLNCYSNNPLGDDISLLGECCSVGGDGCWDSIIIVNGNYYYVTP